MKPDELLAEALAESVMEQHPTLVDQWCGPRGLVDRATVRAHLARRILESASASFDVRTEAPPSRRLAVESPSPRKLAALAALSKAEGFRLTCGAIYDAVFAARLIEAPHEKSRTARVQYIIDSLEKEGLVRQVRPEDGPKLVELTPAGRKVAERLASERPQAREVPVSQ